MAARDQPLYGWCCGKHRPPVAAQSGYVDEKGNRYCKRCFRLHCPSLYAKKQEQRKAKCSYCGSSKVLEKGFCRPCRRARQCETCGEVNVDHDATVCVSRVVSDDSSRAQVRRNWLLGAFHAPQKKNATQRAVLPVTKPAGAGPAIIVVARHKVVFCAISAMELIALKSYTYVSGVSL